MNRYSLCQRELLYKLEFVCQSLVSVVALFEPCTQDTASSWL